MILMVMCSLTTSTKIPGGTNIGNIGIPCKRSLVTVCEVDECSCVQRGDVTLLSILVSNFSPLCHAIRQGQEVCNISSMARGTIGRSSYADSVYRHLAAVWLNYE